MVSLTIKYPFFTTPLSCLENVCHSHIWTNFRAMKIASLLFTIALAEASSLAYRYHPFSTAGALVVVTKGENIV